MDWVLDFYNKGFSKTDLQLYVQIGWITAEQYESTVGEPYKA
ncbi:XkdX family protein [Lacticaseibacillus saniviri]|nr:XkdX family protein [Lacticaseibacillus saniviri]